MIKWLKRKIERYQRKIERYQRNIHFGPETQIYWARVWIQEDLQWLSHSPLARALCERHLALLDERWEKLNRIGISDFRREVGLCPHRPPQEEK